MGGFLLCALDRDKLGLSRGSAPGWVAPGHLEMISFGEFTLHHTEGIPGDVLEQWEGGGLPVFQGRTSSRYWAAPLLVP